MVRSDSLDRGVGARDRRIDRHRRADPVVVLPVEVDSLARVETLVGKPMTTTAALQSRRLVMVPAISPYVCPDEFCGHKSCNARRDQAKVRCAKCDHIIAPRSKFTEHRDREGRLVSQEHEVCP